MSDYGTYKDTKGLLPTDPEVIKACIETNKEIQFKRLKISCGHDFWEIAKLADFGEVVHCKRCNQFFVKAKVLVWLTDDCYASFTTKNPKRSYGTNNLESVTYVPYPVQMTSEG